MDWWIELSICFFVAYSQDFGGMAMKKECPRQEKVFTSHMEVHDN